MAEETHAADRTMDDSLEGYIFSSGRDDVGRSAVQENLLRRKRKKCDTETCEVHEKDNDKIVDNSCSSNCVVIPERHMASKFCSIQAQIDTVQEAITELPEHACSSCNTLSFRKSLHGVNQKCLDTISSDLLEVLKHDEEGNIMCDLGLQPKTTVGFQKRIHERAHTPSFSNKEH